MAHPYAKFRQSNVERARVGDIVPNRASGGKVHSDEAQDKKLIKKMIGEAIGGDHAKSRMDRPQRARGGKVAKKGTTIVNVITGGQQQPPAPPPMPMPPPGAMPPAPPPGAAPGPMAGGPPPGLAGAGGPPPGMPMRARGGGVKSIGMKVGTPVQHDPGKKRADLRTVTFKAAGGTVSFRASGGAVKGVEMKGGTPKTADAISDLPGGAGGGKGRLAKKNRY